MKPGRTVGVKMRVQVRPTKEQIAQLAEWYSCDLNLSVWTRQHDLDLGSPAGKTDAAADSKAKPSSAKADDDENVAIVPGQKPPQRPRKAKPAGVH